tara:strand:+ start:822 stop:1193 length:372 start_codon:yes stop_codon:yes gene_type:complete
MAVKLYTSGQHIENINGHNIIDRKYEILLNPNNKNKVHVSLTNDGFNFKKKYDNLENFFNQISHNQQSLLTLIQDDIKKFKKMPDALYTQSTTQKKKKYIKSKPKPKPRTSRKKHVKPTTRRN